MKGLIATCKPGCLELNTKADMVFSASPADITETCRKFGQVYSPELADPSKCRIIRKSDIAIVEEESTVVFRAFNFDGKPCEKLVMSLEGSLVSASGAHIRAKVERCG